MKKRGSIIMSLLLLAMLLVLGIGMATQSARRGEGTRSLGEELAARAAAEAGLEDARVKLLKDPGFLPSETLEEMSYSEVLTDLAGQPYARYTVTLDFRLRGDPHRLLRIISVGDVGAEGSSRVRRTLEAEVDLSLRLRDDSAVNPDYMKIINFTDRGAWTEP